MDNYVLHDIDISKNFVKTGFVNGMTDRAMLYLDLGYPIHLRGSAGVGKTSLAYHIGESLGKPIIFMCGSEEFSSIDLSGGYFGVKKNIVVDNYVSSVLKKEENYKAIWIDGRLLTACKNGYTLIYDEFTRARPEINNILLSVLEEKIIELQNDGSGERYLKVHPDFRIIFTSNPEEYVGVYKCPNALLDRMITMDMDIMDTESEKAILIAQSGISPNQAEKIIYITQQLRLVNKNKNWASLRCSIMLAKLVNKNNIKISPTNKQFRLICKDIYSSSNTAASQNVQEKELFNKLIDKVLSSISNDS